MGRKSQVVQAARRIAAMHADEMAERLANPAPGPGDAIGSIEVRSFGTGAVTRWTVLRGKRRNNYQLRTPDGRASQAHGLAWILTKLRPVLLRKL